MTRVLDLIRCQLERNNTKFFVRVKDMEEADWELFEQKILTFEGEFVPQTVCPDCGNAASVSREKRGDKEVTYLYCEECSHLGHQEIPYQEVDLFTFNYRNFRLYINNPDIEGEYVESAAQCLPSNLNPDVKPNGSKKKRGIGGKGPKTEFMKLQFKAFERFLTASGYDGNLKKLNSLANQCWSKNKTKWDAAANATGQKKGYSSSKVLADAYRKSE